MPVASKNFFVEILSKVAPTFFNAPFKVAVLSENAAASFSEVEKTLLNNVNTPISKLIQPKAACRAPATLANAAPTSLILPEAAVDTSANPCNFLVPSSYFLPLESRPSRAKAISLHRAVKPARVPSIACTSSPLCTMEFF